MPRFLPPSPVPEIEDRDLFTTILDIFTTIFLDIFTTTVPDIDRYSILDIDLEHLLV